MLWWGDSSAQVPGLLRKGRVASEGFFTLVVHAGNFSVGLCCMKSDLAEDFLTKAISIRLHSGMNPFMLSKVVEAAEDFPSGHTHKSFL